MTTASLNEESAKRCPLVMVEWEDSSQPIPNWSYLSEVGDATAVVCASVGWLVHDGSDVKALAPNMGHVNDECSVQVSGLIRIPARCIVSIVELDEPPISRPSSASAPSFRPATEPTRQAS